MILHKARALNATVRKVGDSLQERQVSTDIQRGAYVLWVLAQTQPKGRTWYPYGTHAPKQGGVISSKLLILLVPAEGFEPPTPWLQIRYTLYSIVPIW